jgi:alpha-tubulin suppressor-like RCC1 family protein
MHAGLANGRWSDSEIALTPQRALSNVQFRDQYAGCVLSLADIRYCWTTAGSSFSLTGMYPVAGDCKAFFYVDFTGNDCLAPTPLAGNIKSKTVGGCLVKVDGVMFCYGIGERGELGDGRYGVGVYAVEPVPVSSDVRFKKASNLCALSVDGSPYCWGNNAFGQLGIGERGGFATVPTKVATDIRFVDIAGVTNTCALTAEDDVWCWGPNEYGTNGPTATGAFALVPVRVEFPPL